MGRDRLEGARVRPVPALLALLLASAACQAQIVWDVSTVEELNYAVGNAWAGAEIRLAPGVYDLTQELTLGVPYLTICGATGVADDVVLTGPGMNTFVSNLAEAMVVCADYVTIRDLSIAEWYWHGVHILGERGVDATRIINVKTRNIGERHVKGSTSFAPEDICDDVLIERLYMEQTKVRTGSWNDDYVGGIDAMWLSGWTIRDCTAVGIQGRWGGGRGAVFLWNGATDCLVERNVFVDCDRAISFGNPSNPDGRVHTTGGIIRNNFISESNGISLELCYNRDLLVCNNSIYTTDSSPFWRAFQLYDSAAVPMADVRLVNNLVRGEILDLSHGGWTATNNIFGTAPQTDWFVDALGGDLHLTAQASAAIDAADPLVEAGTDCDGIPRQVLPDIGADERVTYCPGDANCDGRVDGGDYTLWADHMHQAGPWPDDEFNYERLWAGGDFNLDRIIDGADYTLWADNYGFGTKGGAPVPEPATLALLAAGLLPLASTRRRG